MSRNYALNPAIPDQAFSARSRTTWEIVSRVAVYLKPYKGLALATMGCAVLSLGCSFAFPKLTMFIIDEVIGKSRSDLLVPVMLGLIGAFFLRDFFNSVRIRVNNRFEQNVIYDMRREVYERLQRLPVRFFDQRASGDLMTRVIEDVNAVERVLIDGTEQGVVSLLSVMGVLGILGYTNPSLTLIALIPIPFLAGGAMWYTLTAHSRYRLQRQATSAMNALLMDNLQGHRQIKAFGREGHEEVRFSDKANQLRQSTLKVMNAWANYNPSMNFANSLGTALVLWFGGRDVLAGKMLVGELVGFLLFLNLFYDPINRLHALNQLLQAARAAGERVFDILDYPLERSGMVAKARLPEKVQGEIRYEGVSFQYDEKRPVLKGVDLVAREGEMIALVGPTGAGKSTLVNLLPAFYELTEGKISIDGVSIQDVSLAELRDKIAYVSQEAFLFNGTIRENILYGRLDATEEEMLEASKAANCYEFIQRLPEKYETSVGERGVKLSVGEKQRISIARALLKDAPILILDEATASVDTATEKLIQEALERLMKGRTSFVIAHRLSTIRRADQILVIQQGRVIERGNHAELLAADGLYAKLSRIQNTTFIEESFEKLNS